MPKRAWVYLLADKPYGTLYVGVTSNLQRRTYEHHHGLIEGHSKKYGIRQLVWCQEFPTILEAIAFEKRLKKWKRLWKIELVKKTNPQWADLCENLHVL